MERLNIAISQDKELFSVIFALWSSKGTYSVDFLMINLALLLLVGSNLDGIIGAIVTDKNLLGCLDEALY